MRFQTSSNPHGGGGGGGYSLVEVAVHSEEENSSGFCPNYVQEFGLSSLSFSLPRPLSTLLSHFLSVRPLSADEGHEMAVWAGSVTVYA